MGWLTADLSEIFSSRSSADLRQFVRQTLTGLCRMPRLRVCSLALPGSTFGTDWRWHDAGRRDRFSLIVCVSCAMVGCILASTAYSRRVGRIKIERDIYASRFQELADAGD